MGIKEIGPVGAQGRHHSHVGNFPEAMPALGEVPEALWPAGTEDFGRTGSAQYVGAFPGQECLCAVDSYSPDEY